MKLDLGCGIRKRAGFLGVDTHPFEGVDIVLDLFKMKEGVPEWKPLITPKTDGYDLWDPWPWSDGAVEEINCEHFFEHLTRYQRVFFYNELYRVLKADGIMTMVVPHWQASRAWGDFTHDPMPVSEFSFYYLDKHWRAQNAPYMTWLNEVHFECTWGYSLHTALTARNQEYQQYATTWFKEAAQDMVVTFKKRM